MSLSDEQFRFGVLGAGLLLVAGITVARFCGDVSLPPKPDGPSAGGTGPIEDLNASPAAYQDHLAKDAAVAGVRTPTYDEMSRKLLHRVDEGRRVLEVGSPAIDAAGLKLTAQRSGDVLVLDIENTTQSDLAYLVVTTPSPNISGCDAVVPLGFNAMVISKGHHEVRVECAWRSGMAIIVSRVETVELSPLSAWYVSLVPPRQVGIDDRIGRGHQRPKVDRCIALSSQVLRTGIENGEIAWRDLVDFYARHRCQTYIFPAEYRAFTVDGEQKLPAVPKGM
ncbi:MAG: hypothetical protein H6Q90_3987 [Deltaproteobacteria bacterium]|nr:hypothetical protein [Deltaproteobacteria bacterium]